jgi:hypothetical protein
MFAWHWIARLVPVILLLLCISCTNDPVSYVPLGPPAPDSSKSGPPIFTSVAVVEVGGRTAHVSASVRPNGLRTTYWFDYGISASYGQRTRGGVLDSTAAIVDVRDTLYSLIPDTSYHFKLVAANSAGQTQSMDYSFHTTAAKSASGHNQPDVTFLNRLLLRRVPSQRVCTSIPRPTP